MKECEFNGCETDKLTEHDGLMRCDDCIKRVKAMREKQRKEIEDSKKYFEKKGTELFKGLKIKKVEYRKRRGWTKYAPVFILDNGVEIVVSCDDEGNEGGSVLSNQFAYELPVVG